MDKAYRSRICLPNLRILPTFLVDGRVAGTWKLERSKGKAKLVIEAFKALNKKARAELEKKGKSLVSFVEGAETPATVQF